MRAEIDAVLAAGRTAARTPAGTHLRPAALVRSQVRCADFEGQRYCLQRLDRRHRGRGRTELTGRHRRERATDVREETGDLTLRALARAALGPVARARAERAS